MTRHLFPSAIAFIALCCLLMPFSAAAQAQQTDASTEAAQKLAPHTRPDGSKWRIAYYEGGQYPDYRLTLIATLKGLERRGWLHVEIPSTDNALATSPLSPEDHRALWQWLSANVQSDYVELVADAYFTSGDFNTALRDTTREKLLARIHQGDIDLVLAMGTWAGQDLTKGHSVPVVVAAASDPESADIVPPGGKNGASHIFAVLQPGSFAAQIRLFHDMDTFKRLGIVMEDSPEGLTYAGFNEVKQVAQDVGFDVIPCYAAFNDVPIAASSKQVVTCYKELAPVVDAVYITAHRGLTPEVLPDALAPLLEHRIPTFSMMGPDEVRRGVLASMAHDGFDFEGQFVADAVTRIFAGAHPADLNMILESPPSIALNLKTAEIIGYDPPVDILMAADAIYDTIAPPSEAEQGILHQ